MAISAAFPLEASSHTSDSRPESGVRLLRPITHQPNNVSTVGQCMAKLLMI